MDTAHCKCGYEIEEGDVCDDCGVGFDGDCKFIECECGEGEGTLLNSPRNSCSGCDREWNRSGQYLRDRSKCGEEPEGPIPARHRGGGHRKSWGKIGG